MNRMNEFINMKLAEIHHIKEYTFHKFNHLDWGDSINISTNVLKKSKVKKKLKANVFDHLGDE